MSTQCLERIALDNRRDPSFDISGSSVIYTRLTDPQHFPHINLSGYSTSSIVTFHTQDPLSTISIPQTQASQPPIPPTAVAWVKEKFIPHPTIGTRVSRRTQVVVAPRSLQAERQVRQGHY